MRNINKIAKKFLVMGKCLNRAQTGVDDVKDDASACDWGKPALSRKMPRT
jgi:hypothetical protein